MREARLRDFLGHRNPLRAGRMSTYSLWPNVARRILEAAIGDEHPNHGNDIFRCKEAVVQVADKQLIATCLT